MAYLRNVPDDSGLLAIFQQYPEVAHPLLDLHERIMRDTSPFSVAERELIAAYVSSINECQYCHGVHAVVAESFGVPRDVLDSVLRDIDTARVDEHMKPVLRYVDKLTRTPAAIGDGDANAVYAAGWDDRAVHDAVMVCGVFNLMNRMVSGLGVHTDPEYFVTSGRRLHELGYAGLAGSLR